MIFLFVGPSYCGKTYFAREWLLPTLLHDPRSVTAAAPVRFHACLIDDPGSRKDPDGQYHGARRYRDVSAWRAAAADAPPSRVSGFDRADPRELYRLALELGDTILVLDEIDLRLPAGRGLCRDAQTIIQRGRHDGVALVGSMRRLHGVHRDVRSNMQVAFFGNLSEPSDRLYAARTTGVQECDLVRLPPRTFLEWHRDTGETCLTRLEKSRRVVLQRL